MHYGNREKIKTNLKRAALVAVLVFVLWYGAGIVRPLETGAVSVSGIFWKLGGALGERLGNARLFFERKQTLEKENEALQNALIIAKTQTLLYESVAEENAELKRMLGRADSRDGILSRVLSQPNHSPYDIFYIDVGKDHAVSVGSLVVSGDVLLGVVDTVYERTSKIRLFSSAGTEIQVALGKKKIPATARGLGGGEFQITVPRDIEVAEGDAVTYPSIHNYLMGTVLKIESKSAATFQNIFFRAPINIFTAQFVTVTDELILKIEEQE